MGQSKKDRLKRIRRQFALVGRILTTASCDTAMLDFYKQLDLDLRETSLSIQGGYSADLQHVALPVTFQSLDLLHIRVTALQQRLDPARYDDDDVSVAIVYAGSL